MKIVRLLVLSAFIFTLAVSPVVAHLEEDDQSDETMHNLEQLRQKRQEERLGLQEKREEIQQRRQEVKDKVQERLDEVKQNIAIRIKSIFGVFVRRLNAAQARLDKIAERIASRIDKLKAKGVDTTVMEQALANAEVKGAQSAQAIQEATATIEAIDTASMGARDSMKEAKEAVHGAKAALKEYHRALVATIRLLKASSALRESTQEADEND